MIAGPGCRFRGRKLGARGFPLLVACLGLPLLAAACGRAATPDTLVVLIGRDVEGLDPHTSGGIWQTQTVLANLYEGLVAFDRRMALVPALALSWTNPDDYTWEFQLRPGLRFHTGEEVGAEDVVYSLRRARDHPRSILRASLGGVEDVAALPDGRVRLRTREPDASLTRRLRDVAILSRRCLEAHGEAALESRSCGTGPYRLATREAGMLIDVERFEAYRDGPAPVPKARFVIGGYADPSFRRLVPAAGRLMFGARYGSDLYRQALQEATPRFGASLAITYLAFDLRGATTPGVTLPDGSHRNPFLEPRVRRALALGIDRRALKDAVVSGHAFVASQLVAPPVLGFDPTLPEPRPDPAEARRLLRESPFRDGFEVRLDLRESMQEYGAALAGQLAGLGVRVRPDALPEDEFFARTSRGASSLYVLRFSCRTGDAQEFDDKWVHSRDEARGYGEFNYSYARNPVPGLDALIEGARGELRPRERLALLRQVMREVLDAQLAVPLLHERDVILVSPDVDWEPRADTFRLLREASFR